MSYSKRPIIGINLDYQSEQTFSAYPWYALRCHYFDAVSKFGGLPIALPYQTDLIDNYLDLVDGLIIPGGRFNIDPAYYGQEDSHLKTELNEHRTQFEFTLCKQALARNLPILGICGGMQLLNVVEGGTLKQCPVNHDQEALRHQTVHSIDIKPNTLLHKIYPHNQAQVNSSHRQAVDHVAIGGHVCASASDGIIEAIEFNQYNFCLGVEWHPEFLLTDLDHAIFDSFIKAAVHHND